MAVAWFRNPDIDEAVPLIERDSVNERTFGVTESGRHPAYVYGVNKNSCLMHKVALVTLQWYAIVGMNHLGRLKRPASIATTVCGYSFALLAKRSRTCTVPLPNSVLCGRCHGQGASFPRHSKQTRDGIPREVAKVSLGCEVAGYPSRLGAQEPA